MRCCIPNRASFSGRNYFFIQNFQIEKLIPPCFPQIFHKRKDFSSRFGFQVHYNKKKDISLKKKIILCCEKPTGITRKTFLSQFLIVWVLTNSIITINDITSSKNSQKIQKFFKYMDSNEYKKKENSQIDRTKKKATFNNLISRKEKNIEVIDKIINLASSALSIGMLIFFGISSSERSSNKIMLPELYSPNQIIAYYKLRPEKIFKRLSQIFFEMSKLFVGLTLDYLQYPNKDNLQSEMQTERTLTEFFATNYKNYDSFLRIYDVDTSILRQNFFIKARLLNVLQIVFFRYNQTNKKFWQIKWDNRAKQVRETIAKLSPAFIKLAQALASRPDLVDERISKELQRLQDDMPFFANEEAFDFIKKELGANPEKIFIEISKEPVAAASLGQVYKANLDGVQVAVKVQRPGLLDLIALDIFVIRFFASVTQKLFNIRTDLVLIIDEYAERLFEELDYRKESSNMIKFRSLYGYMDMIYIPRVFLEYSSKHVLVIEWVDGDRLVKNSVKSLQEDVSLIEIGVRCSLVQLLETGFLHCDPHGGNLVKTKDGRLAYLDFGLVSEIPETVRYSFISAILNLINREYESLAKDFNGMALIRSDDLDKEISKISQAFFETFDKSLSNFDKFTFQDVSEKIFRLTVNFPFILPPYFLNNLRAIATLEGLALTADPNFKIADVIYPYIINKLLTNSAPQFQAALEDFLIDSETKKPNWDRLEALLQDPEWTETFSDQSVSLSDTLLNFIISPTGKFLRNLIILSFLEISIKKTFMLLLLLKKKFMTRISSYKNKTSNEKLKVLDLQKLRNLKMNVPNFKGSKIYNLNTFFLLTRTCVFSTVVIISEFFFKILIVFFEFFILKIERFLNFPVLRQKN